MDIDEIKRISIRGYLAARGVQPQRETQRVASYLSPLRKESTPSFTVDLNTNLWYDHGLGKGGSIIDLVMIIDNLDLKNAIQSLDSDTLIPIQQERRQADPDKQSAIAVTDVLPLRSQGLISYLASRGIPAVVAMKECKEVRYKFEGNDKEYYAVGFSNDEGG